MHPRTPWTSVTFVGVFWNDAERVEKLLTFVRPWFKRIAVAVQKSDDDTLGVCQRLADVVIEEPWLGRGDPSIQKVLNVVKTPWSFVVSSDEMPTAELLDSFQDLVDTLVAEHRDGAWVRFISSIDGFDFTRESDAHLRLFRSNLTWPSTPHARVMTDETIHWPVGAVHHDRSLDEMMSDYVRRWHLTQEGGWGDTGIQAHNVRMMQSACNAIADKRGWAYVQSFPWWPEVLTLAYGGTDPAPPVTNEQPTVKKPRRTRSSVKKTTA